MDVEGFVLTKDKSNHVVMNVFGVIVCFLFGFFGFLCIDIMMAKNYKHCSLRPLWSRNPRIHFKPIFFHSILNIVKKKSNLIKFNQMCILDLCFIKKMIYYCFGWIFYGIICEFGKFVP